MIFFAWTFTTAQDREVPEIDFDVVKISHKNFFIMGATQDMEDVQSIQEFIMKEFWVVEAWDITVETQDKLEILWEEYESGLYECATFEGPAVEFEDVVERFSETPEAICVREIGQSGRYGKKIVKVDFLY